MIDRTRFFVNPQHDSEGFTMPEAKCVGCAPEDMCPRSGHCERYDSPLRYMDYDGNVVPIEQGRVLLNKPDSEFEDLHALFLGQREKGDALRAANPEGWQEVDGVKLPSVHTWADYSDEALEGAFQAWLHTSTRPENKEAYRARLRLRIEEMVRRAQP